MEVIIYKPYNNTTTNGGTKKMKHTFILYVFMLFLFSNTSQLICNEDVDNISFTINKTKFRQFDYIEIEIKNSKLIEMNFKISIEKQDSIYNSNTNRFEYFWNEIVSDIHNNYKVIEIDTNDNATIIKDIHNKSSKLKKKLKLLFQLQN